MLLVREGVRSEINPPDMNALEMVLDLKDRYGGRVSILSMGPPEFEQYLRVGLAMGADEVILLSDRAFAGADTLATTYTLAQGIDRLGGAELIFCGEESADGATGQVPSGLAEWLGIGQLTLLTEVDVDIERGLGRGRREVKGGYEILEVPLPCVVSVKVACNEPRFMDFGRKTWAFEEAPVTVWGTGDLEVQAGHVGLEGSPTRVSGLAEAPTRERRGEFLEGSEDEIVDQLVALLGEMV
jgi:electron transfer flavoprotein beta subunit